MRTTLYFRTTWIDTADFKVGQPVPAGTEIRFFTDHDATIGTAVIKENEIAIIEWLLRSQARNLLLESLCLPLDSHTATAVREPVIDDSQMKPGDLDLLICPPRRPDLSAALQCKRVTVEVEADNCDQIRKLGDIKDVVLQANKQKQRYGFHQNYLAIIIQSFVARRSSSEVIFRGITSGSLKQIYEFNYRDKVHDDVGVIFIDITQLTWQSVDRMARVGVCVDRRAEMLLQPSRVTGRIEELLRNRSIGGNQK
ncbi:MAG TPA: hypothetical protein VFD58_31220 [Blastocatellia bacterium]|nr:hypothetical protein [Blastocatellia bacterium]